MPDTLPALITRLTNVANALETPAAREYLWGYYRDELHAICRGFADLRDPVPETRFWTNTQTSPPT